MLGKSQNANESFNGTIWECIPKNTFVTLPNLEFGVYDGVAHCNIRMKASVLIYEKLNFVPVVYILKGLKKRDLKRINLVNQRASRKNKLRRQILWDKKCPKMTQYLKKEIMYMFLEKLKYILVYLDACYVILITGCSNYLQLRHFFPLFWFFLKIAFF